MSSEYLVEVKDLKQYFPTGKKGMYVKANDGITLDIYEGETFGLVGESGCGKSTLGRAILQVYKQTDGRTMYYGRSRDEIAPAYIKDTIKNLEKRLAKRVELEKKLATIQAEYDKLDESAQYAKHEELRVAKKEAKDALLDVATILGGLMTAKDLAPVKAIFLEEYESAAKLRKAELKRQDLNLTYEDAAYAMKKAKENGKTGNGNAVQNAKNKLDACDKEIAAIKKELEGIRARIDEMRKPMLNDPEFQKYEAYRDDGIDLARLTYNEMRTLRSDLQLIFQDPYSSLNSRFTVGQIIGEGMIAHKFFRKNDDRMKEEVMRVMDECGLAGYFLHRYPHQFSGGQRQRIGIARSLALKPKFVVCDEAVSALDVSIQAQIINLLQDLKDQQHLTYLFITHDLSVVKYISDDILVMYLGKMVEKAPSDKLFEKPMHPYTQALLSAIPVPDPDLPMNRITMKGEITSPVNPGIGCRFAKRCPYATEACTAQDMVIKEMEPGHFCTCLRVQNGEI